MRAVYLLMFIVLTNIVFAQNKLSQSISGTVVDAETNQAIVGASIVVLNTIPLVGTSTDIEGNFFLPNINIGTYSLQISFIGYESKIYNDIYLSSAKGLVLEVVLQEKINQIQEISVRAKRNKENINEMASVSVNSVASQEAERISGGLSDPQRILLSYAGVKNQGDINNGISIRGNKPTSMLWQLEGIEIQDPNHFTIANSFGGGYINGAVSAISSNLVQNINLYTGAFPAQYGNATSGVMDLTFRKGKEKNFEYNLNLGVLGVEASAEGPIQMGGTFLVSYRYSTLGLMANFGFDVGDAISNYHDINYKIHLPTKKIGAFTIFGLAGWSVNKDLKNYLPNIATYEVQYNSAVFGLSHKFNISKKAYLKNTIAFTQSKNHYHFYSDNFISEFNVIDTLKEFYQREEKTIRYANELHWKWNSKNKFVSGIKINIPHINLYSGRESSAGIFFDRYDSETIQLKNSTMYLQAFAQWKHRFNEKLSANTGIHLLYFSYNGAYSLEPRFSLKWQAHKKHRLSFGLGLHSKIERLSLYMAKTVRTGINAYNNENKDLGLSKAFHIAAVYQYEPIKNLSFKIEPYFQYLFDVPQATFTYLNFIPLPNGSFSDQNYIYSSSAINNNYELDRIKLKNDGSALNFGLELTAQKHFSKNYYILLASSIYRSLYKSPEISTWQPTNYDALFGFSFSAGKDFLIGKLKQNKLSINARLLWSGGNINAYYFQYENTIVRNPNYYKIDTRIAYILNKKNFSFSTAIDLLNTTNHINITEDYLVQGSGILSVLSFNFRFQTQGGSP